MRCAAHCAALEAIGLSDGHLLRAKTPAEYMTEENLPMRPIQQGQLPSIMPTCSAFSRTRLLGSRMTMSPCCLFSRCSSPVMLASLPSCDTKNLTTTWTAEGADIAPGDHRMLCVWHLTGRMHACTLSGMWECLNASLCTSPVHHYTSCRALRMGLSGLLDVNCDEAREQPCCGQKPLVCAASRIHVLRAASLSCVCQYACLTACQGRASHTGDCTMCVECRRALHQAHLVGLRRQPHPGLARSNSVVPVPSVRGQPYEELDLRPAVQQIRINRQGLPAAWMAVLIRCVTCTRPLSAWTAYLGSKS